MMGYTLGQLIISASLIIIVQRASSQHTCTSLADLAEPCGCTLTSQNFEPVCGTDGRSYMNSCFLDCQQTTDDIEIKVLHSGACSKNDNCVCSSHYAPVCGSNGLTYPNDCVLQCKKKKLTSLGMKHKGVCVNNDDMDETRRFNLPLRQGAKCVCNPTNRPVCATNDITYTNFCVLRCKSKRDPTIKFRRWGPCAQQIEERLNGWVNLKERKPKQKKACGCGTVTYYICANGRRYQNPCEMECDEHNNPIRNKPASPCDSIVEPVETRPSEAPPPVQEKEDLKKVEPTTCYCSAVNRPVCGSNGLTYTNNCVLHCTTLKDPSITFRRWGPCGENNNSDETIRLVSRGIANLRESVRNGRYRSKSKAQFNSLHRRI